MKQRIKSRFFDNIEIGLSETRFLTNPTPLGWGINDSNHWALAARLLRFLAKAISVLCFYPMLKHGVSQFFNISDNNDTEQ